MCKCRSHGTFPLFGLQSSHLNICYYHQDLHRRPLRPGSRPRFCSDRRALLLIEAWLLPRRPGIGRALQRHPFSGLVDSAVLLTKNGPLGALDSVGWLNKAATPSYLFKNSFPSSSYPEGNFGGNQLLDGSISLSPLYPSQTNDLHAHTRTLLRKSRSVGCAPVRDPANQLPCALRVYSPVDSHTCQTPWSVFQDGSNGEPTGRRPEHADAEARREARAADHD
ncbi:unnamed protein product [Brassica rapa subsp. trilocularis]